LIDGLTYDGAEKNLGYAEHLIEECGYSKVRVLGEMPSVSRPIYETLLTGLPVSRHGITSNLDARRSDSASLFDLCRRNSLGTAASAYYWISELYTEAPFDPVRDLIRLQHDGIIEHGIYYFDDDYPDSHVFVNGEYLRLRFDPDFILIHSMNIDSEGHKHGSGSYSYHDAIVKLNAALSLFLPEWMQKGYDVVLTADHGMNSLGFHGGNSDIQRLVPLYLFSNNARIKTDLDRISQLAVAPLICGLLNILPSGQMKTLRELDVELIEL